MRFFSNACVACVPPEQVYAGLRDNKTNGTLVTSPTKSMSRYYRSARP